MRGFRALGLLPPARSLSLGLGGILVFLVGGWCRICLFICGASSGQPQGAPCPLLSLRDRLYQVLPVRSCDFERAKWGFAAQCRSIRDVWVVFQSGRRYRSQNSHSRLEPPQESTALVAPSSKPGALRPVLTWAGSYYATWRHIFGSAREKVSGGFSY